MTKNLSPPVLTEAAILLVATMYLLIFGQPFKNSPYVELPILKQS
jgi:hypothetical protein